MPYTVQHITEELANGHLGFKNLESVYWNLPTPSLYEQAMPETLDPIITWSDAKLYRQTAEHLAGKFKEAFVQFNDEVCKEVRAAGPR